ncbi:MAG TPA: autotransporter-associated beta strand repeat-containing protein [Planctomycetota bacterium]|nr:autotransporter-associated beta strand repeat-containing protein [Planctomycetota bacterium]
MVIVVASVCAPCWGASYASAGDGDWNVATTWSPNGVPVAGDSVSIGAHTITLTQNEAVSVIAYSAAGTVAGGFTITLGGAATITVATGVTGTMASAIGGSAGLTKTGAGVLVVSAANGYTGTTTISAGTLRLSGANGAIATSTSVVVESGATLDIDATSTSADRLADAGTLTMRAGSLTWTANAVRSETIATMAFTKGHSAIAFTAVGGSPTLTASAGCTRSNSATFAFNRGASPYGFLLFPGQAVGLMRWAVVEQAVPQVAWYDLASGIVQRGTGTQFTATTDGSWITPATWGLGAGTGPAAGDHVDVASGLQVSLNAAKTISSLVITGDDLAECTGFSGAFGLTVDNIYLRGTGLVRPAANNLSFGAAANEGVIILASGGTVAMYDVAATLTCGPLTFSSATGVMNQVANYSAYTGNINIAGGTLRAGHNNALGTSAGRVVVYDGGTLDIGFPGTGGVAGLYTSDPPAGVAIPAKAVSLFGTGVGGAGTLTCSQSPSSMSGAITIGSDVIVGVNTAAAGTFTLSGAISGYGGVTKTGAGTLVLSGAGSWSGGTTVAAGAVRLGANNVLPNTVVTITDAAGAALELNGFSDTIGGLSGGGPSGGDVALGAGTLTIASTATETYAGVVSGGGSLVKSGAGTLTLSGTNAYTGVTTLSGGTLRVDGSTHASSAVTVASAATIGGSGTINGNVTVSSGGRLAPGSASGSAGTLSVGGNLVIAATTTSVLAYDLAAPGSGDRCVVGGALTLDGVLQVNGLAGFGAGTYTLLTSVGAITDVVLTIGRMPAGYAGTIVVDNAATPREVNLVVTALVTKTWAPPGPGAGTWNNAAHWSPAGVPDATNAVLFDASPYGCSIATTAANVGSVTITSAYSATITQSVAVTANSWSQDGGTFTGDGSTKTFAASFSLTGGTFTTGSGTMTVATLAMSGGILSAGGQISVTSSWSRTGGTFTPNAFAVVGAPGTGQSCVIDNGGAAFSSLTASTGTTVLAADSTVSSSLTINASAILSAGSHVVTLTGAGTPFINNGTFSAGTSTINYTGGANGGTVNLPTNVTTFHNLGLGTAIDVNAVTYVMGSVTNVTGVLTVGNAGSTLGDVLNPGGVTLNLNGSGTPFMVANGSFTPGTSTVQYNGTAATTVAPLTYHLLAVGGIADGAAVTYTLAGATTVANRLTIGIASTAIDTLAAGGHTLTLSGATLPLIITASFGAFSAGTSSVRYTGGAAAATVAVAGATYYDLSLGAASDSNNVTYSMTAATTVLNTVAVGNAGSTNSDSLSVAAAITLTLNGSGTPLVLTANGAVATTATGGVTYAGLAATNIAAGTYGNLGVGAVGDTSAVTYTLLGDTTVSTLLTVGNTTSNAVDTLDASNRTLTLAGAAPFTITAQGAFTPSTSTVNYTATAATAVTGTTYYNLGVGTAVDVGAGVNFTLGGDTTVTNVVTVGNAASTSTDALNGGSRILTLTASGTPMVLTARGSYTGNTSTVNYAGTAATNVAGGSYYRLTLGSAADANAVTYTLIADTAVSNALTIGNAASTAVDSLDASNRTLSISTSGTAFVITAQGAFIASTSTVNWTSTTSAAATNIPSTTFYNLGIGTVVNATATTYTLAGNVTVANVCTVGNPATVAGIDTLAASSFTLTLTGSGTPLVLAHATLSAFSGGTSTVRYVGTGPTNVAAATYNRLEVGTDADGVATTYTALGNLTSSLLTIGSAGSSAVDAFDIATRTLTLSGTGTPLVIAAQGSLTTTGSTVAYNGATAAVTVTPYAYHHLGIRTTSASNTNTVSSGGAITVAGDLTVGWSGGAANIVTFDASANAGTLSVAGSVAVTNRGSFRVPAANVMVGGNWTIAGTFTHNSGTISLTNAGVGNAIASGGQSFNHLTFTGGGAFTMSAATTVAGTLTLGTATLVAPATTLTVAGDCLLAGGTFTHNGGTIALTGVTQTLTGSSTFFNLTKSATALSTLSIEAGSTQTVAGALTLSASLGVRLRLRSTVATTRWLIDPQGAVTASRLDVADADNLAVAPIAPTASLDSGNTVNWFVVGPRKYWIGPAGGSFANDLNWSTVSSTGPADTTAPGPADIAEFDGGNDAACVIDAAVDVDGLRLVSGYTSTLAVDPGDDVVIGASGFYQQDGVFIASTGALSTTTLMLMGGSFTAPVGAFSVSGSWSNTGGTFVPGTGAVTFTAGVGTIQQIESGGTAVGKRFHHVSFTGAGTLQPAVDHIWIDGDLTLAPGAGAFDNATAARDFTILGDTTMSNLAVSPGAATWTFTGDLDYFNVTTWTGAASTMIFNGVGSIVRVRDFAGTGAFTVPNGASITLSRGVLTTGVVTIGGTVTIPSGQFMTIGGGSPNLTVLGVGGDGSAGRITGAGGYLQLPFGAAIVAQGGVIDNGILWLSQQHNANIAAARYDAELTWFSASFTNYFRWRAGTYTFTGDLLFETAILTSPFVDYTFHNNTNNPDIIVHGDVAMREVVVPIIWNKGSGTITLGGTAGGTQTIDMLNKSIEALVIDAVGAVKRLTGSAMTTAGVTVTAGTFDLNQQNLTLSAGSIVNNALIRLAGSETLTGITNLDIDTGTVEYRGRGLTETIPLKDFGATDYNHLTIADTGGNTTFALGSNLTTAGTLTLSSGTLDASTFAIATPSAIALNGGTLRGTGTVAAITAGGAGGTIAPGSAGARGTLTTGAVSLSGGTAPSVAIRIAGLADHDQLNCGAGALTLGGGSTLSVDCAGLTGSGTIELCTAGSVSGRFASVQITNGWGLVSYTPTAVRITVAPCALEYKFDATAGTTVTDTSGNGLHGSFTSGFTWEPNGGWTSGSLHSDDTSYVTIPASPTLEPAHLGVSLWVKRSTSWAGKANFFMWSKGVGNANHDGDGWYIESYDVDGGNSIALIVDSAPGAVRGIRVSAAPDSFFPLNQWVHLFFDFDSGTSAGTIYKNGAAQPTIPFNSPASISTTGQQPQIGRFEGSIDLLRVYSTGDAALAAALAAEASATWDGGGADDDWSTAANWVGDLAPGTGDNLVFSGASRLTPTNDYAAGASFNAIIFAASGFTVGGNAIALDAGVRNHIGSNTCALPVTASSSIAFSADAGATLTASGTIANGGHDVAVDGAGDTTLGGVISGAGTLTKSAAGTLTLSAANTFTGATSVLAGTVRATGTQAASATIVTGGALRGDGMVGAISGTLGTTAEIRPGTVGACDTLEAASADVSQGVTTYLRVTGYGAGAYDRLDCATAGGALTLGGASILVVDLAGLVAAGTASGALTFTGAPSGVFDKVQTINNPNLWVVSVDYGTAGQIDIHVLKRQRAGVGVGFPPLY